MPYANVSISPGKKLGHPIPVKPGSSLSQTSYIHHEEQSAPEQQPTDAFQDIQIHDVTSFQSFAPESPCDSIKRAEHEAGGGEQHKPGNESREAARDRPGAGRRQPGEQPEGRKKRIEDGAKNIRYAQGRCQRKCLHFPLRAFHDPPPSTGSTNTDGAGEFLRLRQSACYLPAGTPMLPPFSSPPIMPGPIIPPPIIPPIVFMCSRIICICSCTSLSRCLGSFACMILCICSCILSILSCMGAIDVSAPLPVDAFVPLAGADIAGTSFLSGWWASSAYAPGADNTA